VRKVAAPEREALEKDDFKFNIRLLIGGQIKGQPSQLLSHLSAGKSAQPPPKTPHICRLAESKYGRPILDRGIVFGQTTLDAASVYTFSPSTVGRPIEILIYRNDTLEFDGYRRFFADRPELNTIHGHGSELCTDQWRICRS
jgi:putative proteasome-type protease